MPASPMINATWPSPSRTRSQRLVSERSSSSRPTNGVNPAQSRPRRKASAHPARPHHAIKLQRLLDALEFLRAEVLDHEQSRDQPLRSVADRDGAGCRRSLQPAMRYWAVSPKTSASLPAPGQPPPGPNRCRRARTASRAPAARRASRWRRGSRGPRARRARRRCRAPRASRSTPSRRRPDSSPRARRSCVIAAAAARWKPASVSRHCSGSSRAAIAVEPTTSQNSTVRCRRSPATSAGFVVAAAPCVTPRSPCSAAAHWPQKSNPGGFSKAQSGQIRASEARHLPQNFMPGGLSNSHFRQRIGSPPFPEARSLRETERIAKPRLSRSQEFREAESIASAESIARTSAEENRRSPPSTLSASARGAPRTRPE